MKPVIRYSRWYYPIAIPCMIVAIYVLDSPYGIALIFAWESALGVLLIYVQNDT
jgi:hypothetical protein